VSASGSGSGARDPAADPSGRALGIALRRRQRRGKAGLRLKLALAALVLVCSPLLVVWGVGLYERFALKNMEADVASSAARLERELVRRAPTAADLVADGAWLAAFAHDFHLMVRVVDASGRVVQRTPAAHAERWSDLRAWFGRAGGVFFGPAGSPALLAYEATLPPEHDRPEVRAALSGSAAGLWRGPEGSRLMAYYRALPLPGGGAVYLTRVRPRTIRALFDLRWALLRLTVWLGLVAAAGGIWVGWSIVRPLRRLQAEMEEHLRRGGAQPTEALARNDEIGDLSRDLRVLTERLGQRVRDTARLASDLAHDMKNPIATVRATADLLADGPPADERRAQRLASALTDASSHLRRSVDGLLELARLEERLAAGAREVVRIDHLLRDLLHAYRSDPLHVDLDLRLSHDGEAVSVWALADDLVRALRNLLDNAAAHAASQVQVTLSVARGEVVVRVADDGRGVSEGNRDKVFRRFFTTRPEGRTPGTGLGLAIVQTVAEAHGGSVSLDDGGPLAGACFELRLPRARG